ncbi:MAG TPA: hypothetical protein VMV73_01630 [Candidatus Dormibacteraeota bacterium]|nr:hypothetical protein [Candidatus Dormibacteraeota bacterium]
MNGVGIDTSRAFERIDEAKRAVTRAFAPGGVAERGDISSGGGVRTVLDPLSVSAPANASFVVRLPDGRDAFTADGAFSVRSGALLDASGNPVLGYARPGAPLAPLHVDAIDGALSEVRNLRIDARGSLCYDREILDPRTGKLTREMLGAGKIALARFPAGTRLRALDSKHEVAPSGVAPHLGTAGERGFGDLRPFSRARSGVDLDASLQRLQEAYLTLEALLAAHKAKGADGKTTMDLLK